MRRTILVSLLLLVFGSFAIAARLLEYPEATTLEAPDALHVSVKGAAVATDGAITSGQATLTSASNPFIGAHQNDTIVVEGAGAGGADLVAIVLTFVDAGEVTLDRNAGTTVSGSDVFLPQTKYTTLASLQSSLTVTSGSNNQVLTDDGAGGIVSEPNLTWTGDTLKLDQSSAGVVLLHLFADAWQSGNVVNITSANAWTTGTAFAFSSTSNSVSTGEFFDFSHTAQASALSNRAGQYAVLEVDRRDDRSSGTTTDNFDVLLISRDTTKETGSGTHVAAGSVLNLTNTSEQIDGTVTDSVHVLEIGQSQLSSGDGINIDMNGGSGNAIELDGSTFVVSAVGDTRVASLELGHASDTTFTRVSAGVASIEGATIYTQGGALGTPASGVLTNTTGLPISTGVSGLGTNVVTFLATPSSANLAAALTDEVAGGKALFGDQAVSTDSNPQFSSIGIGTSPLVHLHIAGSQARFERFADIASNCFNFLAQRGRGTVGSPSAVQSGDQLFQFLGNGYGSTSMSSGGRARFRFATSQTWTDSAQGTDMSFWTTANGTTTTTQNMTLTNAGNLLLGTTTSAGTNAVGVLALGNGTAPTSSPADMIQLFSVDLSAGNATLGLRTETAVGTETALTANRSLQVRINGTTYKLLLATP